MKLSCQQVEKFLEIEITNEQLDDVLNHIEECPQCDEKWPPMTQKEFEEYISSIM